MLLQGITYQPNTYHNRVVREGKAVLISKAIRLYHRPASKHEATMEKSCQVRDLKQSKGQAVISVLILILTNSNCHI